jgi:murein L,D-transpeptidase YcbB/YkuD
MAGQQAANAWQHKHPGSVGYQALKQGNDGHLLWFDHGQLNLSGLSLLSLVNDLGMQSTTWFDNTDNIDVININKIDQMLTQQLITILSLQKTVPFKLPAKYNPKILAEIQNKTLAHYVEQLLPQFNHVVRLRRAIAKVRQLLLFPWPSIDKNFHPKLGQASNEVIKLRAILSALGDLSDRKNGSHDNLRQRIFDPEIILALKRFQGRHGLSATGKLTLKTRSALARTPLMRLQTMQVNLWRWLSLPSRPADDYVMINIASYRLSWVENKQQKLAMKVIVGKKQQPTPIINTRFDSLTVNPHWTPTDNIVTNELLPQNSADPGLLKRENFILAKSVWRKNEYKPLAKQSAAIKPWLTQYRLIQLPGNNNALGKYRINIKNSNAVFLHDTPVKHLFARQTLALSHGCVRLQFPERLVSHLLAKQKAQKQQQAQIALQSGETSHIKLNASVAVYITYQTVWVDARGKLNWRHDIYQLDRPSAADSNKTQSDASVSNMVLEAW